MATWFGGGEDLPQTAQAGGAWVSRSREKEEALGSPFFAVLPFSALVSLEKRSIFLPFSHPPAERRNFRQKLNDNNQLNG
jgi:hypothetical protein